MKKIRNDVVAWFNKHNLHYDSIKRDKRKTPLSVVEDGRTLKFTGVPVVSMCDQEELTNLLLKYDMEYSIRKTTLGFSLIIKPKPELRFQPFGEERWEVSIGNSYIGYFIIHRGSWIWGGKVQSPEIKSKINLKLNELNKS